MKGSDRLVLDTLTVDGKNCPATMCHGISCYYDLLYFTIYMRYMIHVLSGHAWVHMFHLLKGNGCINAFFLKMLRQKWHWCLVDPTQNFFVPPCFVTLRLRWSTLASFISGGCIGRFRTCRKLSLRKEMGRKRAQKDYI